MARLLRVMSWLLLLETGSEANSAPGPSATGKVPFAGGKFPDLSKLGKTGKAPNPSKFGKAPDLSKFGKGKAPDLSKLGKGKAPDLSKLGKGKPPDLSKWGKGKLPDLSKVGKHAQGGKAPPWQGWQNAKTKEFIERQFKVMDSDQDGQVTPDELTAVVAALRKRAQDNGIDLTPRAEEDRRSRSWEGFKVEESSLLLKTEVNNPAKSGAAGWFATVDENQDGTLTLAEYQASISNRLNNRKPPEGKRTEL